MIQAVRLSARCHRHQDNGIWTISVMKVEDLKLEEIESSHTLGGAGEVTRGEGVDEEGVDTTLMSYTHR